MNSRKRKKKYCYLSLLYSFNTNDLPVVFVAACLEQKNRLSLDIVLSGTHLSEGK